jgi:plastocyanin
VRRARALPALAAATLALALAAPAALADQQITAGPGTQYLTTSVTMNQGERLTFTNLDTTGHDVTAKALGPDGKPLFNTPVIGTGASAFVEGSQYLTTGDYEFICSIHPFMKGTLTVTAAGKPAPRPGGSDKRAPGIALEILSSRLKSVAKSGKLRISFNTDEPATVVLTGAARAGKRSFKLARASRQAPANRPVRVTLKLSNKARKALGKASKARFSVSATTRDAAGNQGSGGVTRTLKR